MNVNVSHGLWVTMYYCGFINSNECPTLVQDVDSRGGCVCWGRESIETVLSVQFCSEPKRALEMKFIIKPTNQPARCGRLKHSVPPLNVTQCLHLQMRKYVIVQGGEMPWPRSQSQNLSWTERICWVQWPTKGHNWTSDADHSEGGLLFWFRPRQAIVL